MKNKNLTELVFILDRSGSMSGLEADTIGGYNTLLGKQKNEKGEATVTTVLFDDRYEMIHDHVAIGKIKRLTNKVYYARGMTGLLDAIGKTINHVGNRHKNALESEIPSKTMIVIITDGHENSSREYTLSQVRGMIKRQQEKYGWEFLFLGANIDAVKSAENIGIVSDRAVTYKADSMGTRINFDAVERTIHSVRNCRPIADDWKADIEKHREDK